MTGLPAAMAVAAAAFAVLAVLAVAAPARGPWRLAVAALAFTVPVAAAAGVLTLIGRPQPPAVALTVPGDARLEVLFADWSEGEGIYVLTRGGDGAPRLYALPWARTLAEQLRNAAAAARDRDATIRMANVFRVPEDSLTDRIVFSTAAAAPDALAPGDPRDAVR